MHGFFHINNQGDISLIDWSKNGTKVNENKIIKKIPTQLKHNDKIQIADNPGWFILKKRN